jgi:adenylylsulfate kinase-like enzyme
MKRLRAIEQRTCCYWFTGLLGAGKSTLLRHFEQALRECGYRALVLDGNHLREGLNKGPGFSRVDRAENIRRIVEDQKAREGLISQLSQLTGWDDPYEARPGAELGISTTDVPLQNSIDELVERCAAIQLETSWIPG